jgi:ABC-type transporter MlaC component
MKVLINILLCCSLLLCSTVTPAYAVGPEDVLQDLWARLQKQSAAHQDLNNHQFIQTAVKSHYDFQGFYEKALADHWGDWSTAQRLEFSGLFERMLLNRIATQLGPRAIQGLTWKVTRSLQAGSEQILSAVSRRGTKEVAFRVFFTKRGQEWKIFDLEIAEALLSRNYRGHFNKIIRRDGYEVLIARIKQKLATSQRSLS